MAGYSTYKKSSSRSAKRSRSYGSLKSRTKSQFKSAKRGNDSLSFVVNSNYVFSAKYDPSDQSGVAVINVWEVLCRNTNFDLMKRMYDQVRIDGIRYKLNVTDAITSVNEIGKVKNYTIYTAWDKTGLSQGQYIVCTANGHGGWIPVDPSDWDDRDRPIGVWGCTIGSGIVNNSTAQKSILNSFQRWNAYGSCYPYLLNEKSQYIQTSDINLFNTPLNESTNFYEVTERYGEESMNSILAAPNPVIPFESTSCRFKPCLLVGVFSNGIVNGQITQYGKVDQPVIFNAEFTISLTFRNLKGTTDTITVNTGNDLKPTLVNNPVLIRPTEQQMDVAMNTATKGFDLNNGDYGSLVIDNLKNNEMVVSNPNNANYATSITIQLPKSEELTPIDLNGLIIKGAPIQAFNEQNNQNWTKGTVIPDVEIPWDSPLWVTVQKPNQNMRAFSFSEIPIQPNSTAIIVEEPEDDEPNNNPESESDNEEKDKRITVISNNNVNPIIVKTVNTVKYILAEAVPILTGIAGVVVPGCAVVVKVWSAWNSMKEKLGFTVAPTVNSDAAASIIEWYADTDLGNRDVKMRDGEPSDEPSDEPSNDEPSSPTVIELPDFDKPFGLVLDGSLYKFRTSSN